MTASCFAVPVSTAGALYIMPCPAAGSMERVLDELQLTGIHVVVSMLAENEAHMLGAQDEPAICEARSIVFLSYPITDFGLPENAPFADLIAVIAGHLRDGRNVAVHCRAGIGRSGMAVACTLVALGETAEAAIKTVSRARGVSIPDTVEQGRFIEDFANSMKNVIGVTD